MIKQCQQAGFKGGIWPVHSKGIDVAGLPSVRDVADLPGIPDAVFIGVNRDATIGVLRQLVDMGAGGAVCFASGFSETDDGQSLQADLLNAAGDMPILGPNCYGYLNYLDGALLWPDQHGGVPVERGVAILTQSSNIALNLTMQKRGLPIAYLITTGNQAQQGFASIGMEVLQDDRVTALGLHIEGVGDIRAFEALAQTASRLGKPIIALKVGKSEQARAATISHTASLAGGNAGADALLRRLGIGRVETLAEFLETLKFLHVHGKLDGRKVASLSCSGGEAALVADAGWDRSVEFPPLSDLQKEHLSGLLSSRLPLVNPLDYHTDIWRDFEALTGVFSAMTGPNVDVTMVVLDFPIEERCDPRDWNFIIGAVISAVKHTRAKFIVVSSLPETMPEPISERLISEGIAPLCGIEEALVAVRIAAIKAPEAAPIFISGPSISGSSISGPTIFGPTISGPSSVGVLLSERKGKQALAEYGVKVPRSQYAKDHEEAGSNAEKIGFPVVLKGDGIAHKSDKGAVVLNLYDKKAVIDAARVMPTNTFLVEEMVGGGVIELLVGVVHDPAHGFVLTLATGGVMTELLNDRQSLLVPTDTNEIDAALGRLKIAPILNGYRGSPPVNRNKVITAVLAVQDYVLANACDVSEIEINPLLCTESDVIALDVLISTTA